MSAYRVPIVVAALAVIALGAPCKDGAAHGDTCGTVVDVDGIDSGDMSLVQNSMKIREVALHEALKPGETAAPVEAPVEGKGAGQGKAAAPVEGKGAEAATVESNTAAPGKVPVEVIAATPKPSEKAAEGESASVAVVSTTTLSVDVVSGKDNATVMHYPKASAEAASLSALVLAVICWL